MESSRLIAFCSPAMGCGKTAAAMQLVGMGYTRVPFAGPLKRVAAVLMEELGATPEEAADLVLNGKGRPVPLVPEVTVRQMLQRLGTEFGRQQLHPEVWNRIWTRRVTEILGAGGRVVVDDLRFADEAGHVLSLGGIIVRISRPGHEDGGDHASENSLGGVAPTAEIRNDGTLLQLQRQVAGLVNGPRTPTPSGGRLARL